MTTGYTILANNSIPYSDVAEPLINLQEIGKNNITLIGPEKYRMQERFDDYSTQESNLMFLHYTNIICHRVYARCFEV